MIRGQKVEVIKPEKVTKIDANLNVSIHNRFDVEVIRDGEIIQKAYAENIILDNLWAQLFHTTKSNRQYFKRIQFGSGNGSLSPSRTSLFSFVGSKAAENDTPTINETNGWVSMRKQILLAPEEYVGEVLTEVGISGTSGGLVTHALIKDMNGNNISILKTNVDVINIYATIFVHAPINGYDGGYIRALISLTSSPAFFLGFLTGTQIPPTNYDQEIIGAIITSGFLVDVRNRRELSPFIDHIVPISKIYDADNRKITITVPRLPVDNYNIPDGIKTILLGSGYEPSNDLMVLSSISLEVGGSWYSGTSILNESIGIGDGITLRFKTKYSFVSNATVYINGLPSNPTVISAPLLFNNMGAYFKLIKSIKEPSSVGLAYPVGSYSGLKVGDVFIYYNPNYNYGISTFSINRMRVHLSNDLINWVSLVDPAPTSGLSVSVPLEYQNYKYWKFTVNNQVANLYGFTSPNLTGHNIIFDTPPPEGALITADYTTKSITKDENHVFDLTVTIQLGEKTS